MDGLAVGVIGAGAMGTRHAMNLHHFVPGARVAAIYDLDQERARQLALTCDRARTFDDPTRLIQDAEVDAVLVTSPDPTHAAFVQECLRRQKPVFCEKPLATTVEDARAIVDAEQALGHRLISVGFNRRFDPQHLAVRQLIDAGEIGRPILFKGVHPNPSIPPDRPGTLVITNSAIHDLDAPRWLLGQEITEVYVRGIRTHASLSHETRDMLLIQMVLSGECLATLEVSVAIEYGYEVSAEIVGQRGTVMTLQPNMALVRARQARWSPVSTDGLARFQESYLTELAEWAQSIQARDSFSGASAWDGYMAALSADACIQSLHAGAPVVVPTPARPPLYR